MTSQFDLESYLQEGFLRLPGMVPADLLQRLRELFDYLMAGHESDGLTATNTVNGRTFMNNVEKPVCRGNLSGLELMGFPSVLEIARAICGEDFFSLQDFGVVKMLGDNVPVLWHQDMVHGRTGRCFVMGVYLDVAGAGDGALKVVPRSHTSGRHICALQREPSVDVSMQAGNILIHYAGSRAMQVPYAGSRVTWMQAFYAGSRVTWMQAFASADEAATEFRILAPLDGATVLLDPDLPDGGRRLVLRTTAPASEVEWSCPTLRIEPAARGAIAVLEPGEHTLTARSTKSGVTQQASIKVRRL